MEERANLISFEEYYREYLGLNSSDTGSEGIVVHAQRRAESVACFYVHHLISTVINGKLIYSVSPKLADEFSNAIGEHQSKLVNSDLCKEIDDIFIYMLPALAYNPMLMHRMTLDDVDYSPDSENYDVIALTEGSKTLFEKQSVHRGRKLTEFMWNARLETIRAGRYFAIIENDEIASSSFISDIDNRAANIVVSTKDKYRNRGYGRSVVMRATVWCIQNGIRPIYLVDVNNIPSIKLAERLGFKRKAQEIVVSTYNRDLCSAKAEELH